MSIHDDEILEQMRKDDNAFILLQEVIMRGRNGLPYKHLLPLLKKALQSSNHATSYVQSLTDKILGD